ncbi:MAG: DASH family cryptochrome [Bacteroidota bacterium]
MKWKRVIVWFRNDLRLHDHEALVRAIEHGLEVIPVYVLDSRQFGETSFGFPKTGPYRTKFLLESLAQLRARLKSVGSDLIVRKGLPEVIIPEIANQYGAGGVYAHKEVTEEELNVEKALEKALFKSGIDVELIWGSTLYHLADLPMPVRSLPEIFTHFRKEVEKFAPVRNTFPTPESIPTPYIENPGHIPSVEDMGMHPVEIDTRAVLDFRGGEIEALERLQTYFWEEDRLREYKETRNGLLGQGYSSKFSPWLALGCISPRHIYKEVKRYEKMRKKNSSTYWLIFELIWRDYFRFVAKRYENLLFLEGGIKGEYGNWRVDWARFEQWKDGMTGIPFIDANMRELRETGFMSNRGRQNVASFLVKDLRVDWRMGAEWFESVLLDYDVCSNWGNWNYVAGIGNDPRENRYFNVISQAKRYDAQGDYVRHWLPELESLPNGYVHEPYEMYPSDLKSYGVSLGGNYPHPIINLAKSARTYARKN